MKSKIETSNHDLVAVPWVRLTKVLHSIQQAEVDWVFEMDDACGRIAQI